MFKRLPILLVFALFLAAPSLSGAAPNADFAVPERVEVKQRACQELMRIAGKYHVEGIFPQDFEQGKTSCSRIDFAAAVELLTEKLAEKVVKEPSAAIEKADLEVLNDLKEELRGEMLLVHTRAFQQRNEDLGTKLHGLTKNISISGGLVGVIQGSVNSPTDIGGNSRDHLDVVGRGDIVFEFKITDHTIAVVDLESTGGWGVDRHFRNYSILNNVADATNDRVRFRQAFVEHSTFNDRLIVTAGKVDLTNYFDSNAVAGDETSQFISGAFVHNPVLGAPEIGPGARILLKLTESLSFQAGYGTGDGDSADAVDHGYGIIEAAYRQKTGDIEGNVRIFGTADGTHADGDDSSASSEPVYKLKNETGFGGGISIDQQITSQLTLFGRYGLRQKGIYNAYSAWSAGFQYQGLCPMRKDDIFGFAWGQIAIKEAAAKEKLTEVYYKIKVSDQIAVTPFFQYLLQPMGEPGLKNAALLGMRTLVSF